MGSQILFPKPQTAAVCVTWPHLRAVEPQNHLDFCNALVHCVGSVSSSPVSLIVPFLFVQFLLAFEQPHVRAIIDYNHVHERVANESYLDCLLNIYKQPTCNLH